MKKILFIFTLFFISPFVTHAETSTSILLDYNNGYESYFSKNSPAYGGNYREMLSEIISYFDSQDKNFIVQMKPNNPSSIDIYTFDNINTLELISNPDKSTSKFAVENGLYIKSSSSNIHQCSLSNLNQSFTTFDDQIANCNSFLKKDSYNVANLLMTQKENNSYSLTYSKDSSGYIVNYYSSFDLGSDKITYDKLDFMVQSPQGTFSPFLENNYNMLFYANHHDDSLIVSKLFPRVTFSYDLFTTNEDNIITSVSVKIRFSSYRNNLYEYTYKPPNRDKFYPCDAASPVNPQIIDMTNVNGDFIVVIKQRETGKTKTFTFNVDAIGKDATYLKDKVSDEIYNDGSQNEEVALVSSVIKKWFNLINDTFPIISEIGSLLDIFKSNNYNNAICPNEGFTSFTSQSSNGYCLPKFKINFSFIGINKDFNIINYDFYSKYRDFIFTFISAFVAFLTFFKVVNSLERIFKQ